MGLVASALVVGTPALAVTFTPGNLTELEQAVTAANDSSDEDIIDLSSGPFTLDEQLTLGTNGAASGKLTIRNGILQRPEGATTRFRLVEVAAGAEVVLEGVTITGGFVSGDIGGGIRNGGNLTITSSTISGNTADGGNGGGIRNDGTLTITSSTISGNTSPVAGGIHNTGSLTVTSSTISGNEAIGRSAPGQNGGGIVNQNGSITIITSTISGNRADFAAGGIVSDGSLTITSSTIANNQATTVGGGIAIGKGTFSLTASILSGNTAGSGPNCFVSGSEVDSHGSNVVFDDSGCTGLDTTKGDVVDADPLLGPLASNGGPTMTHAITDPDSPAVDIQPNGPGSECPDTDQRGVERPQRDACDAGAFELEPDPAPSPSNLPSPTSSPSSTPAASPTPDAGPAPETTITSGPFRTKGSAADMKSSVEQKRKKGDPPRTRDATPGFTFASSIENSSFVCSIDGTPAAPCITPFTVPTKLERRQDHTLAVHAISPSGVADPTPAEITFRVKKRRRG